MSESPAVPRRRDDPGEVADDGPFDYRDLFDALAVPKVVLDPDLVVVDVNRRYVDTLGLPAEGLVGRPLTDLLESLEGDVDDVVPLLVESLHACLRTGLPQSVGPIRWDLPDPRRPAGPRCWMVMVLPVTHVGQHQVRGLVVRIDEIDPADVADDDGTLAGRRFWSTAMSRDRQGLAQERESAVALQASVLTKPPTVPGLTLDVRYQPANRFARVGGDWYDVVARPSGRTVLMIGDVSGHDVSAAATMVHLKGIVSTIAVEAGGLPDEILRRSELAAQVRGIHSFVAVTVAVVDPPDARGARRVRWARAGSMPPIVHRRDGRAELRNEGPGALLGLRLDRERPLSETVLEPGDAILLFTDGLVERRDERLANSLEALRGGLSWLTDVPPNRLCDTVLTRTDAAHSADDVALVVAHVDEQPGEQPDEQPDEAPDAPSLR
ncbi:PP2C family protein-serine/threonine phosphatase [Isoptericola jiangsuensis]|uniref:PP2C family protein-serine/threonine phosphatase n=1 Tax=Isoptericola jiangsuensis TaxID=548579 RepID=UPI003AABE5CB